MLKKKMLYYTVTWECEVQYTSSILSRDQRRYSGASAGSLCSNKLCFGLLKSVKGVKYFYCFSPSYMGKFQAEPLEHDYSQ